MPKPTPAIRNMPTDKAVAKFVAKLKGDNWDLHKTLASESNERRLSQWCQTCTVFVAIYAVLTGQERVFSTVNATGRHGNHIAASLYGKTIDYAKDQYSDMGYTAIMDKAKITPANRKSMIASAKDFVKNVSPHPWAVTLRDLLNEGQLEEAERLSKLVS